MSRWAADRQEAGRGAAAGAVCRLRTAVYWGIRSVEFVWLHLTRGWKGTARIGRVTVDRMARGITAAVGRISWRNPGRPSGACCFEVDEPVASVFAAMGEGAGCMQGRGAGKSTSTCGRSIGGFSRGAGIEPEHISVAGLCTRCHPDIFLVTSRREEPAQRQLGGVHRDYADR